jgi:hypothetical protein
MANQTKEPEVEKPLEEYTVAELKEMAAERGIEVPSDARKDEIIALLEEKGEKGEQGAVSPFAPLVNPLLTGPVVSGAADIVADLYGIGREYKITTADIQGLGAVLQGNFLLDYAPAGSIMQLVRIKHSQSVAGPAITAVTAQVSDAVPQSYGTAFDVFQPVSNAAVSTVQLSTANVLAYNVPTAIYLTLIATGANLGVVTAGAISVMLRYMAVAASGAQRWDTTVVTPRVMPPY